jgi:single-strand DNA-binding protein
LAELCSQFLTKGRKVFVEGRLTTRSWTAQDGTQKQTTEIIINDMILLDNRRTSGEEAPHEEAQGEVDEEATPKAKPSAKKAVKTDEPAVEAPTEDEVAPDDIPF